MGNITSRKAISKGTETQEEFDTEMYDKQYRAIQNRAKIKAFYLMTHLYLALMIAFVLMEVEWIVVIFLVFAYALVHGYEIYYCCK